MQSSRTILLAKCSTVDASCDAASSCEPCPVGVLDCMLHLRRVAKCDLAGGKSGTKNTQKSSACSSARQDAGLRLDSNEHCARFGLYLARTDMRTKGPIDSARTVERS
ncbi:hypothetical protein L1887_61073 [Cichorium endivia]|nr:hypothetical protein L1887_61073 [Cichorium endivia]